MSPDQPLTVAAEAPVWDPPARMRNVFDQYSQPENKLTHALACTLEHDRSLIRPFLQWLGLDDIPSLPRLRLVEQQVPGELVSGEEEGRVGERRGLPDLCVFDLNDGWAVLVESKVQSGVSVDQVERHRRTARRHGFPDAQVVVLSVDRDNGSLGNKAIWRQWREVFQWFDDRPDSVWSRHLVRYMQVLEAKMVANDYQVRGTMTTFNGLRFDDESPFSYNEAKRLLKLLREALQADKRLHDVGADPNGKGRSAITRDGGTHVWDFIPLKGAAGGMFTDSPHFTISLSRAHAAASITVPNGVRGGFKTRLQQIGFDGFRDVLLEIERRTRPVVSRSKKAAPFAYALQRHYISQRSNSIMDAKLEFDLRTLLPRSARGGKNASGVKYQPEWAEAMYAALTNKRSNIQLGLTIPFHYSCPILRSEGAIDLYADAWVAMSPILGLTDAASAPKRRKRATVE